MIRELLNKEFLTKEDIVFLLKSNEDDTKELFRYSAQVKEKYIGKVSHLRGLVELSNVCSKDCKYCGIRSSNNTVNRYLISKEDVLEAIDFAVKNRFASIVLQGGENKSKSFIEYINSILEDVQSRYGKDFVGITLSFGEHTRETYRKWRELGGRRYLLRIESSNRELYNKIHPQDDNHSFDNRIESLKILREEGYQIGTGVMVGLPFQTYDDLAEDILFMKNLDIDMCGMGPYIEHKDTPLYEFKDTLLPLQERFNLTLKMIAVLRIVMKDINIAAATALQAIDKIGRERAIRVGANIVMPNITPGEYRDSYLLYQNKPCTDDSADECSNCMSVRIGIAGDEVGYNQHGDSKHFKNRKG